MTTFFKIKKSKDSTPGTSCTKVLDDRTRYFLLEPNNGWKEVTIEEFMARERDFGYTPNGKTATDGFHCAGTMGRILYGNMIPAEHWFEKERDFYEVL